MNKPRLLEQVRSVARMRHLSLRTEQAYADWIRRFILFYHKRHPAEMGTDQIRHFLSHLAVDRKVSASTQNQALCALLFLYRDVLRVELPFVEGVERAKRPARLPAVFTREEVKGLLSHLTGTYWLIGGLLYGSGLRLMEALRLRVKDLDFEYQQITVRAGKGEKDRRTVLPGPLAEPLQQQLARMKLLHEQDLRDGHGRFTSLTRWIGSTRRRRRSGPGSTFSPPRSSPQTRAPASCAAIIHRQTACSER
jgi:integrase